MLYIDNKKIEISQQKIFVGTYTKNGNKGYNINIQLSFINIDNKEKGYINLDAGFEKDNNINCFLNKNYNEVPFENDIFFEIFDTEKFLDTEIESNIILKIKGIRDNKVETFFELNDELIKIKYSGFLDLNFRNTKRTFKSV